MVIGLIQIPADKVTYVRDVKDPTGEYTFSDGVGTISASLRDEVSRTVFCTFVTSQHPLH